MKLLVATLLSACSIASAGRCQDLLQLYPGAGDAELLEDMNGDGVRELVSLRFGPTPPYPYIVEFRDGASGVVLRSGTSGFLFDLNSWWVPTLAPIGDVDGDGFDDAALAYLGRVESFSSATAAVAHTSNSPAASPLFGATSIVRVHDLDGDGIEDYALGYPQNTLVYHGQLPPPPYMAGAGRVDLFSGASGLLLRSIVETPPAGTSGSGFGGRIANLGDYDGDGLDDLLVSNRVEPYGDVPSYVEARSGANGALLFRVDLAPPPAAYVYAHIYAQIDGDLAVLGDVDGDGVPDFAASEPTSLRLRMFSGATQSVLFSVSGDAYARTFATKIRALGDFDGDGVRDIAVCNPQYLPVMWDTTPTTPCGYAQIASGANGALLWMRNGFADYEYLGSNLELTNDRDGDGRPEVLTNSFDATSTTYGLGVFSSRPGFAAPTRYCAGYAHVSWSGSTSLAADDLVLSVQGAPLNTLANAFCGQRASGGWLGDVPCLLGPGLRLGPPIAVSATGSASRAVHPASLAPFAAGTTWNFQFVFYDPAFPDAAKYSDALAVTFTP
jgi:hypothetical protein